MSRSRPKRAMGVMESFAIATVTRQPHKFGRWLEYYRRLGAVHVFLAVENTPEVIEYCLAHTDFVTVSATDMERNPYDSIIDRQVAHVNKALIACDELGIGWLFHVDDDELLHFVEPWESIVRQVWPSPVDDPSFRLADAKIHTHSFARLTLVSQIPATADCLVIANVEAIPDHEGSDFTTISRFCMDDDLFLCYVNGKSAGRVGAAEACGCHRFTGEEWGVPHESAMVLHFESCPYSRWRDKFMHYASLQRKMSTIPFDFYVDSINICRKYPGDEHRLRAFWKRRKRFHYASHPDAVKIVLHPGLLPPEETGRPITRRAGCVPASPRTLQHWGHMRREGLEL